MNPLIRAMLARHRLLVCDEVASAILAEQWDRRPLPADPAQRAIQAALDDQAQAHAALARRIGKWREDYEED